ncbi:MAG TPA: MFS transporter [Gaiellaceae bacterium]|nr:MFS transporter [Gaiellaceae bacterium]
MNAVPLRRNRDYLLLQSGQLLSSAGTQMSTIAYPLLVLALTHSPAKAGIVAFMRIVPSALFALPAGLAADRWPRKRMMIAADLVRVTAMGALGATILLHDVTFWAIALVAFVEGTGTALFSASEIGALRAVVRPSQLPTAASVLTGRQAAVRLAGPPLGGALFGLGRAIPFVADAVSYAFSTGSLLAMRTPFQEEREADGSPLRSRIAEGFRFIWARPFLRALAIFFGLANFTGPGILLALVVIGRRQGLSGSEVGALVAAFGACLLLGSVLSPLVRRLLPIRAVIVLELWTWVGCALFLVWPNVYVLTASILPTGLAIPSTNSVVYPYWVGLTPDRLLGRVQGVANSIALLIAPLGPLAAGFLLATVSERATIAVFAGFGLVLAVWGTLNPSIRAAPSLDELAA